MSTPPQTTTPTLHHLSSSGAHRILWALEELADAYGLVFHLVTYTRVRGAAPPELKLIHPLGKSPLLTVSDGLVRDAAAAAATPSTTVYQLLPGVLSEGRAILAFIDAEYAHGLWTPADDQDRRRAAFWDEFAAATLAGAVTNAMVFELVADAAPWFVRPIIRALNAPIAAHFRKNLQPMFQMLEDALRADDEARLWFAGARMGLADINMSWPMAMAVERGYVDRDRFPSLMGWYARITGREAYKRALARGAAPFDMKMFNVV